MNDASEPATLLSESRDGSVAVLTMANAARRNALSMQMRREMTAALERIEADAAVRAVVITGAGGQFCSGADIRDIDANSIAAGHARYRISLRLIRLLANLSKPVVAAVEGWAAGAGLSLAALADTVVAAEDARFLSPFNKLGLMPDFGLPHTLPARIGQGRARQIMLYGEPFTAQQAEAWGVADHVVPKGQALAKALERAHKFDDMAPIPLGMTRRFLARGLDEALELERDLQTMLFLSADHDEGKQAFLAKRAPQFKGT